MSAVPPAVRWVPNGPRAGLYIWLDRVEHWQRITIGDYFSDTMVRELPSEPAQEMVPISDVGHAIDNYREALSDVPDCRLPDSSAHEAAKAAVLAELREAAELQFVAAEIVRENPLTMEDLRRGYDC